MVDRVAARDDMLHETVVSVMVGAGTERHFSRATIWAPTETRPHPMAGQVVGRSVMPDVIPGRPAGIGTLRVDCGAQRGRSAVRSVSLTAPVTCERCLERPVWPVESLPEDVLSTDSWGRVTPKEA
jgi:hypothetical protein